MRHLRTLRQGVWYEVRTRINNRELLFRRAAARAIFSKVFRQSTRRFVFRIRGLRMKDDWLRFYIKPEDGLRLPRIIKWIKQVFAQRFNMAAGRIGHIWGDRYWSRIVEEGEMEGGAEAGGRVLQRRGSSDGVCPWRRENEGKPVFLTIFPFPEAPEPG
jgi:putative transposase